MYNNNIVVMIVVVAACLVELVDLAALAGDDALRLGDLLLRLGQLHLQAVLLLLQLQVVEVLLHQLVVFEVDFFLEVVDLRAWNQTYCNEC